MTLQPTIVPAQSILADMTEDELVETTPAAAFMGFSTRTFQRRRAKGELPAPAVTLGNVKLYSLADLVAARDELDKAKGRSVA